ncbi:MAG: transposase [Candidatus Thermoplasmatota archaeon]
MLHKKIVRKIFKCSDKVISRISLKIGDNSIYKKEDILFPIISSALYHYTIEAVSKIGLLQGKRLPSPDVALRRLKQKDWKETVNEFNQISKHQFFSARGYLGGRKNFDASIDENRIMRYCKKTKGKRRQIDRKKLIKGKAKNGTHHAHVTISLSIIGVKNGKFMLITLPMTNKKKRVNIVNELIDNAKEIIKMRIVYLDTGFFIGQIIVSFEDRGIKYIIHAPMNKKIKRLLKEFKKTDKSYDVLPIQVGKIRANTKLVIIDKKKIEGKLKKKEKRYFAYITNRIIPNEKIAYYYSEKFRKRWGQETGFRVKDDFLGKTTSLSYNVRIFIIFLAYLLFNIWQSINLKFEKNKYIKILFHGHIETYVLKEILLCEYERYHEEKYEYWRDKLKEWKN